MRAELAESFSIFRRILGLTRPYWRHISASVVLTVFYSLLSGASIYLFIPLLDILFHPEKVGAAASGDTGGVAFGLGTWFSGLKEDVIGAILAGSQTDALLRISVIIIVTFLLKNIFGYLQFFLMNYSEESIIRDLRNNLYRHLHSLPLGFFTNERTGDLISRVVNDVSVLNGGISAFFVTMMRQPLLIMVYLGLAFSLSWKLTLISLVVFPFTLAVIAWIALTLHRERGVTQERMADITAVLHETISGVKVVKAFGMEEFETKKFLQYTLAYLRSVLRINRIKDISSPATEFLSVIAGSVIVWYGGNQVLQETSLSASEFLGFLFIIFQIMPPIKELTNVANRIQEASAAAKRVFEIIDVEPGITSRPGARGVGDFTRSVEFRNVSFSYDGGQPVLKDISMVIGKGEVVALVGPSGAGKTTLVDLIPRFYDPEGGSILIDGCDLRELDLKSLRETIGIVTQETILFNDTIRNNIAYGLTECSVAGIEAAARAANAHGFIMEARDGYETVIGERGVKLSGGERQRLALARAILKNPPILILDEATSALDTGSELLVQEAIDRLMTGRTSVVIAHRLSTIQRASKIFVLDRGRIVGMGTHAELIADPAGLYKKLYDLQFRD
ncbi:MAG TPA: ABC transporter ATP-binding protein [Bacteroidota bacterium]|nr:ABC transporter ATP-binding protein [Bacteroidota bacterium]